MVMGPNCLHRPHLNPHQDNQRDSLGAVKTKDTINQRDLLGSDKQEDNYIIDYDE